MEYLTEKEKKEIENLPNKFFVIKEEEDYINQAALKSSFSYERANRNLKYAFYLNIASLLMILLSFFIGFMKPSPNYYAATPNGSLYGPLKKYKIN